MDCLKIVGVEIVGRSIGVSSGAVGPGMPVGPCAVESVESTLGSPVDDRETLKEK